MKRTGFKEDVEITIKRGGSYLDYDIADCNIQQSCSRCKYWIKGYWTKSHGYLIVCGR